MFVLGSRLVLVKYLNSTGFYGSNSYHLMMNLVTISDRRENKTLYVDFKVRPDGDKETWNSRKETLHCANRR